MLLLLAIAGTVVLVGSIGLVWLAALLVDDTTVTRGSLDEALIALTDPTTGAIQPLRWIITGYRRVLRR